MLGNEFAEINFEIVYGVCYLKLIRLTQNFYRTCHALSNLQNGGAHLLNSIWKGLV